MGCKLRQALALVCLLLLGWPMQAWAKEEYTINRTYNAPMGNLVTGGMSKDGRYVWVVDKTNTIRIYRYNTGRLTKSIKTGTHKPVAGVFHPTRPILYTAGEDGNVFVWDVIKGLKIQALAGQKTALTAIALSPNGELLATGGDDRTINVWKLDRFKVYKKAIEPSRKVTSLDFHPDGKTIGWANGSYEVVVWSLATDSLLASHKNHNKKITQVRFHPAGDLIASADFANQVIMYNFAKKAVQKRYNEHTKPVSGVDFTEDGKDMMTCSLDGSIKLWKLRSGEVDQEFKLVEKPVQFCEFNADTKQAVAVFDKNYVRSWNLEDSAQVRSFEGHSKGILSLDVSGDSDVMASVGADNQIILWSLRDKETLQTIKAGDHKPQAVAYAPSGKTIATGGGDNKIMIWDKKSGRALQTLEGHKGKVNWLVYHPTEPSLLSVGADKLLIQWNLETGKKMYEKEIHRGQIFQIRFNQDGEQYLTTSEDRTAKLWRYSDHQLLFELKGHARGVRTGAFAPGRDVIATGSDDKSIRLWDSNTGKSIKLLLGHEFIVSELAFSSDGKTLVSASRDKTVRIWDAVKGGFLRTLSGQGDQVTAMAATPDGKYLMVGTLSSELNMLKLPPKLFLQKKGSTAAVEGEPSTVGISSALPTETNEPEIGEGGEAVTQETPKKKGIAEGDILEEEVIDRRDNVFDPPPIRQDQDLMALKKMLNSRLQSGDFCAHSREIKDASYAILAKDPDDIVAYYGLLQSQLIEQNLQMVFLSVKLGLKARYYKDHYDYADEQSIKTALREWNDQLFNRPMELGEEVKFEVVNCKQMVIDLVIPENLLVMDIPLETIQAIMNKTSRIPLQIMEGFTKQPDLFRNRIFGIIAAVEAGEYNLSSDLITKFEPQISEAQYGYLELNMKAVRQWGEQGDRITFQLKHGPAPWKTFVTNAKKTRTLLILKGNYYLRVNDQVKRAFELTEEGQHLSEVIE